MPAQTTRGLCDVYLQLKRQYNLQPAVLIPFAIIICVFFFSFFQLLSLLNGAAKGKTQTQHLENTDRALFTAWVWGVAGPQVTDALKCMGWVEWSEWVSEWRLVMAGAYSQLRDYHCVSVRLPIICSCHSVSLPHCHRWSLPLATCHLALATQPAEAICKPCLILVASFWLYYPTAFLANLPCWRYCCRTAFVCTFHSFPFLFSFYIICCSYVNITHRWTKKRLDGYAAGGRDDWNYAAVRVDTLSYFEYCNIARNTFSWFFLLQFFLFLFLYLFYIFLLWSISNFFFLFFFHSFRFILLLLVVCMCVHCKVYRLNFVSMTASSPFMFGFWLLCLLLCLA